MCRSWGKTDNPIDPKLYRRGDAKLLVYGIPYFDFSIIHLLDIQQKQLIEIIFMDYARKKWDILDKNENINKIELIEWMYNSIDPLDELDYLKTKHKLSIWVSKWLTSSITESTFYKNYKELVLLHLDRIAINKTDFESNDWFQDMDIDIHHYLLKLIHHDIKTNNTICIGDLVWYPSRNYTSRPEYSFNIVYFNHIINSKDIESDEGMLYVPYDDQLNQLIENKVQYNQLLYSPELIVYDMGENRRFINTIKNDLDFVKSSCGREYFDDLLTLERKFNSVSENIINFPDPKQCRIIIGNFPPDNRNDFSTLIKYNYKTIIDILSEVLIIPLFRLNNDIIVRFVKMMSTIVTFAESILGYNTSLWNIFRDHHIELGLEYLKTKT